MLQEVYLWKETRGALAILDPLVACTARTELSSIQVRTTKCQAEPTLDLVRPTLDLVRRVSAERTARTRHECKTCRQSVGEHTLKRFAREIQCPTRGVSCTSDS